MVRVHMGSEKLENIWEIIGEFLCTALEIPSSNEFSFTLVFNEDCMIEVTIAKK